MSKIKHCEKCHSQLRPEDGRHYFYTFCVEQHIEQLEARVKELEAELKELHRAQRNVKVKRIEREEFSVKFYTGSCSSAGALARLFGYKAGE